MKNYIIWSPTLKLDSGGVTVLHLLCNVINELGNKAYLWPGDNCFETFLVNAKYISPLATKEMINDDSIIIYPEIVIGNPLNAKNVVRWILNKPGVLGGDGKFGKDDLIYYYSNAFTDGEGKFNHLQLFELYGNMFVNKGLKRKGSCYIRRKGKHRKIVHDLDDSIELTEVTPSEKLVQVFNEKRYFYCYDSATFLSLQAAMCGCISIMVPYENMTGERWKSLSKTRKYGIAYGEDDIEHAITTMDLVHSHMKSLETEFYERVKEFISKTQNWVKDKGDEIISSYELNEEMDTYEIKIIEAETQLNSGEINSAKKIFQDLLFENSSDLRVLNNLALIEIIENNFDEAKNIIEKILKIDNTNEQAVDNYEYLSELSKEFNQIEEKV